MTDTQNNVVLAGYILIGLLVISGVSYTVYETGNELKCGTNKPYGWNIIEEMNTDDGILYKAVCPFTTKEHVTAYCADFRSTASYERYGCKEAVLIQTQDNSGGSYNNPPDYQGQDVQAGCRPLEVVCDREGCVTTRCS